MVHCDIFNRHVNVVDKFSAMNLKEAQISESKSALRVAAYADHCEKKTAYDNDVKAAMELSQFFKSEAAMPKKFECSVCIDDKAVDGSFELDCAHRLCAECLQGHIYSKIDSNELHEVIVLNLSLFP